MRVLAKFEKTGAAAYTSHLDLMRTVQRTLNRAALPVLYSQGFNPHPILSFAQALSLGQESVGEYLEAAFAEDVELTGIAPAFNAAAPAGVRMKEVRAMRPQEPSAMAMVAAAAYRIQPEAGQIAAIAQGVRMLNGMEAYPYRKKSKSGTKQADMRPQILDARVEDGVLFAMLSCGNDNLRPDVYLCEVSRLAGVENLPAHILRTELYTLREGVYIPLMQA